MLKVHLPSISCLLHVLLFSPVMLHPVMLLSGNRQVCGGGCGRVSGSGRPLLPTPSHHRGPPDERHEGGGRSLWSWEDVPAAGRSDPSQIVFVHASWCFYSNTTGLIEPRCSYDLCVSAGEQWSRVHQ